MIALSCLSWHIASKMCLQSTGLLTDGQLLEKASSFLAWSQQLAVTAVHGITAMLYGMCRFAYYTVTWVGGIRNAVLYSKRRAVVVPSGQQGRSLVCPSTSVQFPAQLQRDPKKALV